MRMNILKSPTDLCSEFRLRETISHILFECEKRRETGTDRGRETDRHRKTERYRYTVDINESGSK